MWEILLTEPQRKLRAEVDDFVRSVPRQLLLDMDAERVRYPRHYLQEAGKRDLLGLRFPTEYGGRGLGWAEEILALEGIFELFRQEGRQEGPGLEEEILQAVKLYNYVPAEAEQLYRTALLQEYERFCLSKGR